MNTQYTEPVVLLAYIILMKMRVRKTDPHRKFPPFWMAFPAF